MRSLVLALLLTTPLALLAQEAHEPYPSDYKTHPCAPDNSCLTFEHSEFVSAAFSYLGLRLDPLWVDQHADELIALFQPGCHKHATCLASPGSAAMFCDDILSVELRNVCDKRFPKSANPQEWERCEEFMEIYTLGVDIHAQKLWVKTQECTKQQPPVQHTKAPIVWLEPNPIPRGYKGDVTFYSVDPDTHVPVPSRVTIEDQIIYAPSNPTGETASYYPFKMPIKYKRVPNADGHTDVVPHQFTIKAAGYPSVTMPLPLVMPRATVEMQPSELKPGKNSITVSARDIETGKPVEMRVMLGKDPLGSTNEPIELVLPKSGKHAEIWVTSLFNTYSDAVVAKAAK